MSSNAWRRLNITSNPKAMVQWGPNLKLSIAALTQDGKALSCHNVGAVIDTGAESCCISPTLAEKMAGGLEGLRALSHIHGRSVERTIRGLARFENGVEFIRDFAVLPHLADYDVLIGRDVLKHCRLYLDLGRGRFRFCLPLKIPNEPLVG